MMPGADGVDAVCPGKPVGVGVGTAEDQQAGVDRVGDDYGTSPDTEHAPASPGPAPEDNT